MRFSWIFGGLVGIIIAVTAVKSVPISNQENSNVVVHGETSQDAANGITKESEIFRRRALEFFEQAKEGNKRYLSSVLRLVKTQEWTFQQWKENGIADPAADKGHRYKEDLNGYEKILTEMQNIYKKSSTSNSELDAPKSDVDEVMQFLQFKSQPMEYYTALAGSDTKKQEIEKISKQIDEKFNEWKKLPTLQQLHDEADRIIKKPVLASEKETEKLVEEYEELESKYFDERPGIKIATERLYQQRLALLKPT